MQTKKKDQSRQKEITRQDLVEIYEKYNPRIYKYALRLLGDAQLAEDCASETFSRFLKTLQKGVGPRDNMKAYLYRIAHNWIMDYYRHRVPEDPNIEIGELKSNSGNPEKAVHRKAEQQKVRQALLKLPEDQLQVIMLRFYDDLSHEETASALGKSVEASRALQYRAVKSLKGVLLKGSV
jgi:RNA polymerase sigma-70 factor (ECF subfamily)